MLCLWLSVVCPTLEFQIDHMFTLLLTTVAASLIILCLCQQSSAELVCIAVTFPGFYVHPTLFIISVIIQTDNTMYVLHLFLKGPVMERDHVKHSAVVQPQATLGPGGCIPK